MNDNYPTDTTPPFGQRLVWIDGEWKWRSEPMTAEEAPFRDVTCKPGDVYLPAAAMAKLFGYEDLDAFLKRWREHYPVFKPGRSVYLKQSDIDNFKARYTSESPVAPGNCA